MDEVTRKVNIHRVWTTRFGRQNLLGRAIDYLSFYVSSAFKLIRITQDNDILIAKTDPPLISVIAAWVAKHKKARLINWLQDLFPEVAGTLGLLKDAFLYRFLKKIKDISLKAADMNVVIGEKMADLVAEQGISRGKITIIHNWNINSNVNFVSKSENELVIEWGLKNKFVVGYSGNYGRAHEYEPIKKLVKYFSNNEDIVFLFIGGGKYYDDLRVFVRVNQIDNVLFKPYQDKEKLNQSLSIADIHLISLNPELEGLIVPSKFYGLASIGAPILFIGDEKGEIGQILKKDKCGFVVAPDDQKKLIDIISEQKNNRNHSVDMTANLLEIYKEKYKPEVAYTKWKTILGKYNSLA